jgi:hypothetical protein
MNLGMIEIFKTIFHNRFPIFIITLEFNRISIVKDKNIINYLNNLILYIDKIILEFNKKL